MKSIRSKYKRQSVDAYYNLPSTFNDISASFGIGEKKPSYIMTNDCPSPSYYKVKRLFDKGPDSSNQVSKRSGRDTSNYCSFGIPYAYYDKAMVADGANKSHKADSGSCSPGPGSYDQRTSLKERQMSFGKRNDQNSFLA